jgi:TRAP-type C4-dicarboxylate transport system substrate-binding protein
MKSQKIYLIIGLSAMLALSAASFAQTNNAAAGAATSDQTQQDQAQQTADRVWDQRTSGTVLGAGLRGGQIQRCYDC